MNLLRRMTMCVAVLVALPLTSRAADDIVDTAVKAGSFNTLAAALKAAGLVDTLKGKGPFTVLAPTDEAFAKLPEGTVETLLKPENKDQLIAVLTYHVVTGEVKAEQVVKLSGATTVNGQRVDIAVEGGKVSVDNATVTATDIVCSNGVIHVIDSVILPESKNLAEVAVNAKTFDTLVAAAKAAGLVDALTGDKELTILAPTDEAFAALPEGTVESLLKPENKEKLVSILTYHIIPGRVYSDKVVTLKSAKTLQGDSVSIGTREGVKFNESKLLKADIDASNGVIHVIDSVLMPPMGRKAAQRTLENAVARGAHLYNTGHHGACAELYMDTVVDLMDARIEGLSQHDYHVMEVTINRAKKAHGSGERAWIMRHQIDRMYGELAGH